MIEPEIGWDGLIDLVRMVGALARTYCEESMDELAEEIYETVGENIQNQTLRLAPLAPAYLAWKRRRGLDTRILVATTDYVRAVQTFVPVKLAKSYQPGQTWPLGNKTWVVGPPEGIHNPSGLSYDSLARRLEYGVVEARLPPRPHWRPSFKQKVTARAFKQRMKKIGVKVDRQFRTYVRKQKSRG
jgi:hypothetical protein